MTRADLARHLQHTPLALSATTPEEAAPIGLSFDHGNRTLARKFVLPAVARFFAQLDV